MSDVPPGPLPPSGYPAPTGPAWAPPGPAAPGAPPVPSPSPPPPPQATPGWTVPPPQEAPPGYWPSNPAAAEPVRNNGLAIASLVSGILGLVLSQPVTPLLAFVFGILALRQIGAAGGRQKGRGMAVAGLVLAPIGMAAFVLVTVYQDEIRRFIEQNS